VPEPGATPKNAPRKATMATLVKMVGSAPRAPASIVSVVKTPARGRANLAPMRLPAMGMDCAARL
jgi:hypothetical protein